MMIEGVIVDVFSRWCCVNHGPNTVDESLDFRGSTNKRPAKRGANQKKNKFTTPLYPSNRKKI